MAAPKDPKVPSESSDDDTVSLTSTVASPQRDNYELEAVRWEEERGGVMHYLVKWEGYDELEDTWELKEHFDDEQTLLDWKDQKMRIARGLAEPFDKPAWEAKVEKHLAATKKRRKLRRQKKAKLGLPVADEEPSSEDSSDDEYSESSGEGQSPDRPSRPSSPVWTAKEDSTMLEGLNRWKTKDWGRYLKMYGPSGIINQNLKDRTEEGLQRRAIALEQAFIESGKEFPVQLQLGKAGDGTSATRDDNKPVLPQRSQHKPGARGVASVKRDQDKATPRSTKPLDPPGVISKTSKTIGNPRPKIPARTSAAFEPKSTPAGLKAPAAKSSMATAESASPQLSRRPVLPIAAANQRPTQQGANGRGPARTGLSVANAQKKQSINVMKNWGNEPAKRRKSRYEKISAQEVQAKPLAPTFTKFSTRRKFELAARYEHTPDINSLTFVNPKDGKVLSTPPVSVARNVAQKTPFQLFQEQLKEKKDGPLSVPDAASRPSLQRAATTDTSTSGSNLLPLDQQSAENLGTADLATEVEEPRPPERRASLPLEPAVQRSLQEEATFQAPVAVMGSRPAATKSVTSTEHPVPNPSEVSSSQRKVSLAKEPEIAKKQALDDHNEQQNIPETALAYTPRPANTASHQSPQHEAGTKPTPPGRQVMERTPSRSVPSAVPLPGDGYVLFPLDVLPSTGYLVPRVDPGSTDVIAQLLTGPEGHSSDSVVFRGLPSYDLKHLFITIRVPPREMHVWCKTMCTAGEFATIFHDPESYMGSGWIVPFPPSIGDIDRVSGVLAEHASGGLFFAEGFSLLIYPTRCIGWEFLDSGFPKVPPEARLRFAMFAPWLQLRRSMDQICHPPEQTGKSPSVQDLPLNEVIRGHFSMDYQRLVAQSGDKDGSKAQQTRSFFLIFPASAQEEFEIVVAWLQKNGPVTIYGHEDHGAWDHFCKTVDKGVIICHASFIDYWAIPHLAYTLRNTVNMFNFSLVPMSRRAPDPHLIRLFPTGMAILLTDSLFLLRPMEAARILAWYRLWALPTKGARAWKICTRPAIRDWLLKLQARLTYPYGKDLVSCYGEIMHLLPPGMTKEWDREIPKGEAPIACMGAGVSNFDQQLGTRVSSLVEVDHQAIVRNDVTLCSWFAGWAMMKQEKFRRFHVITGRDDDSGQLKQLKSSMKKYNHLEIMAFEKFAKKHCVWDWTKIKKEDDKRRAEAKKRDERAVERAKSAAARPSSVGENDGDVEMREVGEEDQESLFLPMDMSST